jgi:hypothetical protein
MKLEVSAVILILIAAMLWAWNLVKLTSCDFNLPLKCEAIHAVGLVPPLQVITVWFDTDEDR